MTNMRIDEFIAAAANLDPASRYLLFKEYTKDMDESRAMDIYEEIFTEEEDLAMFGKNHKLLITEKKSKTLGRITAVAIVIGLTVLYNHNLKPTTPTPTSTESSVKKIPEIPSIYGMTVAEARAKVDSYYTFYVEDLDIYRDSYSSNDSAKWKVCSYHVNAGIQLDLSVAKLKEDCSKVEQRVQQTTEDMLNAWKKGIDYEWSSDLVWEWVHSGGDCYGDYCWRIKIVSKNECPNGVYAEINIMDDGVVIDYTNATLGYLGAGQPAILTFNEFGEGGTLTGSLVDLRCS